MTASAVCWVQLDTKELAQARLALHQLQKPGTIDELGFGPARDHFAGSFFPAVTTIMTEIRYFMFLPEMLRRAAISSDPEKEMRQQEGKLLRDLKEAAKLSKTKVNGIIGARSGEDVARFPHEVYWASIGSLGLLNRTGSPEDLYQGSRGAEINDDGESEGEGALDFLPEALKLSCKALADASKSGFKLCSGERVYLRRLFLENHSESLFTYFLNHPKGRPFTNTDLPAAVAGNKALTHDLRIARGMSLVARGAYLVYWHLAGKMAMDHPAETGHLDSLDKWLAQSRAELKTHGKLEKELNASAIKQPLKITPFIAFFLQQALKARSANDLVKRTHARVEQQESATKPNRVRLQDKDLCLAGVRDREIPNGQIWTDYRWGVAADFLNRLVDV